jgi:3'-5' exoribonuclease
MSPGQEADLFLLMTAKEELKTREGKPYFRVAFRDAGREVSFPIWDNSPWAADCREQWTAGVFYKVRATYRETAYGPQLDIRKIRQVVDGDAADGFDPAMLLPRSRFDPETMFQELLKIGHDEIAEPRLKSLVETILLGSKLRLLTCPAARHHHHAYIGGLLEHTLSVTQTAVYLARKYSEYYPDMSPPLDRSLVVAGAILHDIGKLRELEVAATGTAYTAEGELIGHLLLGRDMVREAAAEVRLPAETLLRLEHLVIAHQRLPEWGSPKPPMTPEALLVHYADDIDAKYQMIYAVLGEDKTPGQVTSSKNFLHQKVFRGLEAPR